MYIYIYRKREIESTEIERESNEKERESEWDNYIERESDCKYILYRHAPLHSKTKFWVKQF